MRAGSKDKGAGQNFVTRMGPAARPGERDRACLFLEKGSLRSPQTESLSFLSGGCSLLIFMWLTQNLFEK